jgi:hypothetical protein
MALALATVRTERVTTRSGSVGILPAIILRSPAPQRHLFSLRPAVIVRLRMPHVSAALSNAAWSGSCLAASSAQSFAVDSPSLCRLVHAFDSAYPVVLLLSTVALTGCAHVLGAGQLPARLLASQRRCGVARIVASCPQPMK